MGPKKTVTAKKAVARERGSVVGSRIAEGVLGLAVGISAHFGENVFCVCVMSPWDARGVAG